MLDKKYDTLDKVLIDMPLIAEAINNLKQRGRPYEWITVPADIRDSYARFLPKGKMKNGARTYMSPCDNYKGFWLNGGSSAVQCNAVDFVLPGIVYHLYCEKRCADCPLNNQKGEK